MSSYEQRFPLTGLDVYRISYPAGSMFGSPGIVTTQCLGVFYLSGGMKMTANDQEIPCGAVGVYTPWQAHGVDLQCEVGPDGADWFCLSCPDSQSKTGEGVDIQDVYLIPADTQAVVLAGTFTANGETFEPVSEMRFAVDTQVIGTGTLVLVR